VTVLVLLFIHLTSPLQMVAYGRFIGVCTSFYRCLLDKFLGGVQTASPKIITTSPPWVLCSHVCPQACVAGGTLFRLNCARPSCERLASGHQWERRASPEA
jgi:hypothetical protein